MKKIIFYLTLTTNVLTAQNHQGTVKDQESKQGIENVNIILQTTSENTVTDQHGHFSFNFKNSPLAKDTIYFSHIGYFTKGIQYSELTTIPFSIDLIPETENLNEMTLYSPKVNKEKINFTKLTNLEKGIYSFSALIIGDEIYVIGGDTSFESDAFKKLQYEKPDFTLEDYMRELSFQFGGNSFSGNLFIYNINRNIWQKPKIDFRKRAYHNLEHYNNQLYVIGGRTRSRNGVFDYLDNTIEVYDLKKNTITIDKTNPHQAINFSSVLYNGNIIVMGGSTKSNEKGKKTYSNQVHTYDIKSGYWYQLDDMPQAMETTGILIENKIYIIGGYNNKALNKIESLDLITGKWTTIGELPYAIERPALATSNGVIYIFENGKIYTFDTSTNFLKQYLINLPLKASQLIFHNDRLYLLGGSIEDNYSKAATTNLITIDISEFKTTKSKLLKL